MITPTLRISLLQLEIERLLLENWQLKGALGYEVPGDIPQGSFKCGLCDARQNPVPIGLHSNAPKVQW